MEDTKKKFDYYQNVTNNAISNLNEILKVSCIMNLNS